MASTSPAAVERGLARHAAVRLHGLHHLRVDAQHRVQRHHRVLEDHGDALAANGAQAAHRRAPARSCAVEQDRGRETIRPGGSTSRRIEKPVTDLPEPDSPTRPRISPLASVKLTPSTALATPVAREEMRAQILDLEKRRRHRCKPRIEDVAQPVADEVDADDDQQQRDAGKHRHPVAAGEQVIIAVGDQQAERGLGDRHADAEEGERRLQRDGVGDLHRRDDDQRRQAVGQQMPRA